MTWKYKLPQPARTLYTAREVAASLGIGVSEVMDALRQLNEYVDSPAKRMIEEPVKRKICAHFGVGYEPPATHTPSQWRRTDRGGPAKDRAKSGRPAGSRPKDSGTRTVKSPDRSVGLGDPIDDASVAMEDFSWIYYGFSASDRDAWCVYLRAGQAKYAARLRDAGFMPDDLAVEIGGWTVAKRLRSGERMSEVNRLLKRHREVS